MNDPKRRPGVLESIALHFLVAFTVISTVGAAFYIASKFDSSKDSFAVPILLLGLVGVSTLASKAAFSEDYAAFRNRARRIMVLFVQLVIVILVAVIAGYIKLLYVIFPGDASGGFSFGITLLAAAGILSFVRKVRDENGTDEPRTLRGPSILSGRRAARRLQSLNQAHNDSIHWAGTRVPERLSEGHFCVVGATGSGKTTVIRQLMQSVLSTITPGSNRRAIVYDAKREFLPIIAGMKPRCEVISLNPLDQRGVAWDIAADVTSPARATAVTEVLIPDVGEYQPFFSQGARMLMSAVMQAFHKQAPLKWQFSDVLITLRSHSRLKAVLWPHPHLRDVFETFATPEDTYRNILSTVLTKVAPYEIAASVWSRSSRSISLRDWCRSESILVLGSDKSASPIIEAINRAMLACLTHELLDLPGDAHARRSWIFIDELAKAGRMDGLDKLLTEGRSRGVRVCIGFQDIEGLRSKKVFGPELTNELTGQCSNKAFLRLADEKTSAWASEVIGQSEVIAHSWSESMSATGNSKTNSYQHAARQVILPSEFRELPVASETGVTGYFVTLGVGIHKAEVRFNDLLKADPTVAAYQPRDVADQHLSPWTDNDLRRLGLPPDGDPSTGPGDPGPNPPVIDLSQIRRTNPMA